MNEEHFFALAKAAAEGRVAFDPCFANDAGAETRFEFSSARPPTEPHEKSASSTTVAFGKIVAAATNRELGRVVLKIWLTAPGRPPCGETKGTAYEAEVYRYLTQRIVLPMLAPNFVPAIAYGVCNRRAVEAAAPTLRSPLEKLALILSKHCDSRSDPNNYSMLHVLVTQSACDAYACITLAKFTRLPAAPLNQYECMAILFMLAYALHVLWESAHAQHNDLHTGNVILRDIDTKRPVRVYAVGPDLDRDVYLFTSTPLLREPVIYDWDRAYVDAAQANVGLAKDDPRRFRGAARNESLDELEYCRSFGQCNRPNERFDLYTLLCNTMKGATGLKAVQTLAPTLVQSIADAEKARGNRGHSCLAYDVHAKRSRDLPPSRFPTPGQFLASPAFDAFRASTAAARGELYARTIRDKLHACGATVFFASIRGDVPPKLAIAEYIFKLFKH